MAELLTTGNIMFTLGILGIIFTIYNYFRNPQIAQDKKDALLDQQVQWTAESIDRRFKATQDNFQQLLLQSNNHIHTLDTKVDNLTTTIGTMSNEITRLATIIEERIPHVIK
jgi:cytolysin (calcineurin-like family phosphatase)